jgi:hypothetical protein
MIEKGEAKGPEPQPESDESLVFRYNREHRLSRASENVHWLNEQYGAKRPGFFSSLVATRASRLLLAAIVLCVLFYFLYPIIHSPVRKSGSLDGAKFSASALYYDHQVLVALKREGKLPVEALKLRASLHKDMSGSAERVFSLGTESAGDYRAAFEVGPEAPKLVYLSLELGEKRLSLVLPVE